MANSDDILRKVYQNASNDFDLPDFDTFKQDMMDEKKRRSAYNQLQSAYDMPDFETFSRDIGTTGAGSSQSAQRTQSAQGAGSNRSTQRTRSSRNSVAPGWGPVRPEVQRLASVDAGLQGVGLLDNTIIGDKSRNVAKHRDAIEGRRYKMRWGGRDHEVSEADVVRAGGFERWARRSGINGARVYMSDKNGKAWHVDVSEVGNKVKDGWAATATGVTTPGPVRKKKQKSKPVGENLSLKQTPEPPMPKEGPVEWAEGYERRKAEAEEAVDMEAVGRQVMDLGKSIDTALKARSKELMDAKYGNEHWWSPLVGSRPGVRLVDFSTFMNDPRYMALETAKSSLDNAMRLMKEARAAADQGKGDTWRKSFVNWLQGAGRGFVDSAGDLKTWDMGVMDVAESKTLYDALATADKGGKLTAVQQQMLDAKALEMIVEQYLGGATGRGYKAGQITGESIPFMLEMIINPTTSAGSAATAQLTRYAIKRFGTRALKNKAKRWIAAKVTAGLVGSAAGAGVMAATTGAPAVAADAIDRKIGTVTGAVDNEGKVRYGGHEGGEDSWIKALGKAYGARSIENFSEMMFGPANPYIKTAVGGAMKKIGLGKLVDAAETVSKSGVGEFLSKTKWNGLPEEYLEEVGSNVLNALVVGDMTLDTAEGTGVFNADVNLETLEGLSLMSGGIVIMKTGSYPIERRRAMAAQRRELTGLSARAGEAMSSGSPELREKWEELRLGMMARSEEDAHKMVGELLASGTMTRDQKSAVLNYAAGVMKYRGMKLAAAKLNGGAEAPTADDELTDSYTEGYATDEPAGMAEAQTRYEYQRERAEGLFEADVLSGLDDDGAGALASMAASGNYSQDELEAAQDYVNARTVRDGIIQRVNDDIEEEIERSDAEVKSRVNNVSGQIQPAVMGMDDREVYVVGGRLAVNDDGTIDIEGSDNCIVVRDAQTGEVEMTDPKSLGSVMAALDPEVVRASRAEEIRQKAAQGAVDSMNGTLALNAGDVVEINDGGGLTQVTVVGPAVDGESGMAVEGQVRVKMADGTETVMTGEQLQQMADAAKREHVATAERERQEARRAARRPQWKLNDEFTIMNESGIPVHGMITGETDADGMVEIYTEEPLNGNKMNRVTPAELEGMLDSYNGERITLDNGENDVSLQPKNIAEENGNGSEQNHDERAVARQTDGGGVADDAAGSLEGDRDRGDIRVYETGLAASRNAHTNDSERARRNAEAERLIGIARANKQYWDQQAFGTLGERVLKRGGESEVYIDRQNGRVYKIKDPYAKSPMKGNVQPEDAIYEHLVHNKFFPETRYRFEGISDEMGDVRIVLSQEYVNAVDNATDEQIEAALAEKGLYRVDNYTFGNDEITVTDVTGDNALLGADGKVYFIDPIINFRKPVKEIVGDGPGEGLGSSQSSQSSRSSLNEGAGTPTVEPTGAQPSTAENGAAEAAALEQKGNNQESAGSNQSSQSSQSSLSEGEEMIGAQPSTAENEDGSARSTDAVEAVEGTALERLPRDEKGEPVFERAESPEHGWDALVEYNEGDAADAQEMADMMAEQKRKAYEKAKKQKPVGTTPAQIKESKRILKAALAQAEQEYNLWQQMAGVEQGRQAAMRAQQEAEVRQRAAERAEQEARRRAEQEEAERLEREALEAERKRKAAIDKRLRDTYEDVKDVPEAVEVLEDTAPHDIYEVAAMLLSGQKVLWNDKGVKSGVRSETGFGEGERRKLFGLFASEEKGGKSLQTLAEDYMMELCRTYGVAYDNQDARNALIDVISSAHTMGDIRNYIINNRIDEALRLAEGHRAWEEAQYDDWCRQELHMSAEEVEAYEEHIESELSERDKKFDEKEYNDYIADEMARMGVAAVTNRNGNGTESSDGGRGSSPGDRGVQEDDASGERTLSGRGDEVLPEPRADQRGGASSDGGGRGAEPTDGVESDGSASAVAADASRGGLGLTGAAGDGGRGGDTGIIDPREMSDDERRRRGDMLRNAEAIEVEPGQIVATKEMSARKAAEKWWDDNVAEPAFYDTEVGEVEINKNSIESSLAHKYGQMKLDAITSLIDGFENAVYLGTMPDSRERGVVDHYFAYPISYNGKRCYVFCRAMQDANKNRLYVHEVYVADRIKKGDTLQTAASKPHGGIALYRDILANVLDVSEGKGKALSSDKQENGGESSQRARSSRSTRSTPSAAEAAKPGQKEMAGQSKMDGIQAAVEAAEAEVNTSPTPAQAEAGNYKKGRVTIGEFDITIENPRGSVRSGKGADGKEWHTTMANTYGEIRGTKSVDGDPIDVFLHSDMDQWNGRKVFVVDQTNRDGSFDEHKVMLGFNDKDEAMTAYLANYDKTWADTHPGLRISETNIEDFNKWLESSHRKTKPFADYTTVKKEVSDAGAQSSSTEHEDGSAGSSRSSQAADAGYETIEEHAEYSVEIRHSAGGDVFAVRLKKGAKPSEWKADVGDYGAWSNDGRGEVLFDSFEGMVKYLESRGEDVKNLSAKAAWAKRDTEINEELFAQTGLREGQSWTGPDGTVVTIGARGFVKGPRGWDFATTVAYKDGRTESTLTPATRISEFFEKNGYKVSEADKGDGTQFHREVSADDENRGGNREVYEAAKAMLESAGVPVIEVSDEEARRMLEQMGRGAELMGSRTDRKMEMIAGHYADKELDESQRAVVDVFCGKRDNVAVEVERPEGKKRVVMRQGKDMKAGTKHSLFRHFGTSSNYITADDIAMIPEIIAKGERKVKGKRVVYEYVGNDGTRFRVTTETRDNAEVFTNFYTNRKTPEVESSSVANNAVVTRHHSGAQSLNPEVSDAKVDNNFGNGKPQLLRRSDGVVYGWTQGGKVYLNRDAMNPETPLHEYTHLWDAMVRRENPGLWARGVELMKQTPLWDAVVQDPAYADIAGDEDAVASEVHSRLTGREGAKLLQEMIDGARKDGAMETAKAVTLVEQLKSWLSEMFRGLKETLGKWSRRDLKNLTLDDFNRMTMRDLARGMDPHSGDRNLVAVHNLSEEKLMEAIDLGGFPMPSVAITRADMGHGEFGEISLVFGRESIDPKDRLNKVYGGDAWTPMFPTIGYKLNADKTSEIYARARAVKDVPFFNPVHFYPDNYERRMDGTGSGNLVDAFMDDYGAKQMYLSEHGKAVEKMMEHEVEKYTPRQVELYDALLNEIGEERLRNESRETLEPDVKRVIAKLRDIDNMKPFRLRSLISNSIYKALDYAENGNLKKEGDTAATQEEIDRRIDKAEYRKWLEDLFDGVVEKKGIRNEQDWFTPSGTARKWESLYDAVTLDNVVRAMRRQSAKGGNGLFGGNLFGAVTKGFNSIDEIRSDARRRIKAMSGEDYEAEKKKIEERLESLSERAGFKGFEEQMGFEEDVKEAIAKSDKAKDIYNHLKRNYPDLRMETAEEIADIVHDIHELSTRYFEAKPQRAVGLNEVKLAVVPEGTSQALVDRLESLGVTVKTYERGNERQRQATISRETSQMGLRFHAAMSRGGEEFEATRDRAVAERGIVMPGLNEAEFKVTQLEPMGWLGGFSKSKAEIYAPAIKALPRTGYDVTDSRGRTVSVTLNQASIKKFLEPGSYDEKREDKSGRASRAAYFAVFNNLKEVLKNAVEAEVHGDYGKDVSGKRGGEPLKDSNKLVHRYFSVVEVTGFDAPIRVEFTIFETNPSIRENRVVHSQEVQKIELTELTDSSITGSLKAGDGSPVVHSGAKLLKGVEKSYDPGKKLLEESAEAHQGSTRSTRSTLKEDAGAQPSTAENEDGSARSTDAAEAAGQGQKGMQESRLSDTEILERQGDGYGAYSDAEVSYMNDPISKVMGRNRFSKKRQAEFAARERQRMAERIEAVARRLHLDNVVVVTDVTQLDGKRAKAKGFFNKRTGKITIVIPNNVSTIDAEQTLLHEAVAHYGLRRLFGKQFDTFLDNVYESADENIRRKIAEMAARNGWNFRTATEEYLAGLAEDTPFEEMGRTVGWWSTIKQLFINMLETIGLDGFRDRTGIVLTDNELRYMLWRSYQNLAGGTGQRSMMEEAEDVVKQSELKVGNYAEGGIEAEYAAEPGDIKKTAERFDRELEQYEKGELAPGHRFELGMPSRYLKSAGFPALPISLRSSLLARKAGDEKHPFEASDLRGLVEAFQMPIAIFEYTKDKMRNLIVDVKRGDKHFLVGVTLDYKAGDIEINSVSGLFPKESHEWIKWIQDGKAIRIDQKEKVQEIIDSLRTNPAESERIGLNLDDTAKLTKDFKNPPIEEEELYRPGDFTPRDKVLARDTYERIVSGGRYQFKEATGTVDDGDFGEAEYVTDQEIERINARQQEMAQRSPEAKRGHAEKLAKKLGTPIEVVEDVSRVPVQLQRARGWYEVGSGRVVVVLPNNASVEDVAETVFHEVVAHKGLREMVGKENYDAFCDEVYDHLKGDLKEEVDRETTRRFVREPEKGLGYHRRVAVDELFGRMAEKGFEDFTRAERGIWAKLKEKVMEAINKFLGSLRLPKWVRLGDNELRYMLWRSHERLKNLAEARGRNKNDSRDYVEMARDVAKREELGLNRNEVVTRSNDAKRARIEKLRKSDPVFVTDEMIPQGLDLKDRKAVKEALRATIKGEYTNEADATRIRVSNKGIKEVTSHGMSDEAHVKSLFAIGPMLRHSIFIDERVNEKDHTDYDKYRYYVCGLKIDGEDYTAKLVIGQKDGQSYYDHRLSRIEKGKLIDSLNGLSNTVADNKLPSDGYKGTTLESLLQVNEPGIEYRLRDGETGDIWKDQSVGLEERITNAAIRLSNNHRENLRLRNDAVAAIGGNLTSLRKAMAAQKHYDQSTVKRVADLARILLQSGYLSGLTSGEVQRLLSAVKNSVGRKDVDESVQKIMDLMVSNQLRNGEVALRRLLTIKGSKVDARGVEVQGALDVDGQRTLEVVKKAMSLTEDDITGRMAEALNRMGDIDQTIADHAALEYAGLNMALDYVQNIAGSKAEVTALRDSLETAKEDRDAGRMTDDAYKQFVEATEDAIRKNKIERAEAYFNLVGRLSDSMRGSIENAKAFREAEKARVNEIRHNANSDMEGRPAYAHHKDDWKDKLANNSMVQFLFAPLGTFDQILRVFGNKSANGEGYLWNRFMRGWVESRNKELRGVKEKFARLDEKVAEIFAKAQGPNKNKGTGKVKSMGDMIKLEGKLPKATVSFMDGDEMCEHELTQGNLLYIYMVDKMTDGRMKLRSMGITEDHVANVEKVLDPRFKALGDWLQEEFLVETRNEYNETHKRMFGASMAAIENYFPLKILPNARVDKVEDVNQQNRPEGITTKTGSIIKRRVNNLALDITGADALSIILDHITQMEHWNAYAEWNRDLNTLRTYKRFRNQVMNMTTVYGGGRQLWEKFNDLCLMAAGEYRPPVSKLNKSAVNLTKGVTAAKVSLRMYTALKQLLSAPAYLPEVSVASIAKSIANPYGDFKWCLENMPIFRERWQSRISGDPRLLKSDMDWKMWRSRIMELSSRIGMTPNAFVDAVTVSIGARAMYQTRLKQYVKEGYPEEIAKERALQDATILFNQTQQSSESPFLSTMQVDKDWLSTLFTVFRNSSMSYTRQEYDALRNLKRNLTPGQRRKSIEFMTKQILRDWDVDPDTATDAERDQAQSAAKKRFRRQIKKDVLRLATFGFILELAWNLGPYLPYLIFGDDDDEKEAMWDDALTHSYFGSVEGLTGGDVMSSFGNMWASGEWSSFQLTKDMPLASDLLSVRDKFVNGKNAEALNDIFNLAVQMGVGMNPQSITDTAIAITDACGDDPRLSHEAAILVMRILQVPQSQLDKLYFDEIGLSGSEASKLSPGQLARRYAEYKVMRGTPLQPWTWTDEERLGKYEDKATKRMKELLTGRSGEAVNNSLAAYDEEWSATNKRIKELKNREMDVVDKAEQLTALYNSPEGMRYNLYKSHRPYLKKMIDSWLDAPTAEGAAKEAEAIIKYKADVVRMLDTWNSPEQNEAAKQTVMDAEMKWNGPQ